MNFNGWPAEALEFYKGLETDNSRAYWTAHENLYETAVRAPMEALLAELPTDLGHRKTFRPYRDIRFSTDKSPYKTHIGAVIGPAYVQLSAAGLAAGGGIHRMASDQLLRYRQSVADDDAGPGLERVIASIKDHSVEIHGHEALKAALRGYPADHPRATLLRYKGLSAWKEWPAAPWLATAEAKERILVFLDTIHPLSQWLATYAGVSSAPAGGR